jgi:DNA-binding transcriptional LysR family regulator
MPVRLPSPTALRAFDSAARCLSFKDAAAELAVTPTAVSHHVRSLEQQLGVALFLRKTRRIELTPEGRRLAEATHAGFSRISAALDDLAESEPILTVTTTPALAGLWMVPRLAGFEHAYPSIRVHLETGTQPIDLTRDRRVDLAIRYGPADRPALRVTRLTEENVGAYATPEFLARLDGFEAAPLIETRWQQPGLSRIDWTAWATRAGYPIAGLAQRIRAFDDEQQVLQAGLAGRGLVLMSELLVTDPRARGWLVPYRPEVSLPGLSYTALATRTASATHKVRAFLDWLQREVRQSAT